MASTAPLSYRLVPKSDIFAKQLLLGVLIIISIAGLVSTGTLQRFLFQNNSVLLSSIMMAAFVVAVYLRAFFTALFLEQEETALRRMFDTSLLPPKRTITAQLLGIITENTRAFTGSLQKNSEKNEDLAGWFHDNLMIRIRFAGHASATLLLLGFLGTVYGVVLMGMNLQFGTTAQQSLEIARNMMAGMSVAASTTALGILGSLLLRWVHYKQTQIAENLTLLVEKLLLTRRFESFAVAHDRQSNIAKGVAHATE